MKHAKFKKHLSQRKANEQVLKQQVSGTEKVEDNRQHLKEKKDEPNNSSHLVSAFHQPIVGLSESPAEEVKPVMEKENIFRPETQNRLNRQTFFQENKELYHQEKSSFFEWIVIAIFLIILAVGIFLLKPAIEPVNEFSSPPFEYSERDTPGTPKK